MAQLFVISAPSGTGKTSLIYKILEEELASKTKLGISCTTRKKRENEEEGVAYFFLTEEEFNSSINSDGISWPSSINKLTPTEYSPNSSASPCKNIGTATKMIGNRINGTNNIAANVRQSLTKSSSSLEVTVQTTCGRFILPHLDFVSDFFPKIFQEEY